MTRTHWHALILLVVGLIYRTELLAHIDPTGEIYPTVVIEDGKFVVYFQVNQATSGGNTESEFRRDFNAAGKQLRWTRRASKPEVAELTKATIQRRTDAGLVYQLDPSAASVTISGPGTASTKHKLAWPDGRAPFGLCHDYAVTGGRIFVLAYPEDSKQPASEKILTLYSFDTIRFRLVEAAKLGKAASIYHRPTASPLIPVGGLLAFAWMGTPEGTVESRFSLTVVDPRDLSRRTLPLDGRYLWNTGISAAAIGNRICIAWHDGEAYGKLRKAKIRTLMQTITLSP